MRNEIKEKDWTIPDSEGNINMPDELDSLFNRIGFQVRLITISGLNEIECIARMVKGAKEFSDKNVKKAIYDEYDFIRGSMNHGTCYIGKSDEEIAHHNKIIHWLEERQKEFKQDK